MLSANVKVKARDVNMTDSGWSPALTVSITSPNSPPATPLKPTGPTTGLTGESITFTVSTTDPDGDQVKYGWDWNGDDTVDEWRRRDPLERVRRYLERHQALPEGRREEIEAAESAAVEAAVVEAEALKPLGPGEIFEGMFAEPTAPLADQQRAAIEGAS